MLTNNVIAIDLAKNVLQICHISVHGELLFNRALSRNKTKKFLTKSKPSIVAIEGYSDCHYWGQLAERCRYEVRILNPSYLKGHKTDDNDTLTIANAAIHIRVNVTHQLITLAMCSDVP